MKTKKYSCRADRPKSWSSLWAENRGLSIGPAYDGNGADGVSSAVTSGAQNASRQWKSGGDEEDLSCGWLSELFLAESSPNARIARLDHVINDPAAVAVGNERALHGVDGYLFKVSNSEAESF